MSPPGSVWLGGLACVFGGIVALELMASPAPPAPLVRPAAAPAPTLAAASPAAPRTDELLARPLFAPSRRPDAAPVAPADLTVPHLTGIIVSASERRALFEAPGQRRSRIAAEGDTLGPYRVESISPAQVVLAGPAGPVELHPRLKPADPAPPTGLQPIGAPIGRQFGGPIGAQPPD